jgi:vitamin B12 transporter
MNRKDFTGYVLLMLLAVSPPVYGYSEEEMETLQMFYGEGELVTTSTRSEKPVFHVAENITVITADDIEGMNAHTVLDVLYWVPGVQVLPKTPGVPVQEVMVQGSRFSHVRVMIDGVTLNNYSDNFPDLAIIPVRIVERIEIVLGPASSAWGSALGGVVNIITKTPGESAISGGASASGGGKGTVDVRGDASGSVSGFGYYLSGSELRSDGFRPNNGVQQAGTYGKATWKDDVSLSQVTAGHFHGRRGISAGAFDFSEPSQKILFTTASHRRTIGENLSIEASLRTLEQGGVLTATAGDATFLQTEGRELTIGGSLLASWRDGTNNVTGGVDFDFAQTDQTKVIFGNMIPIPGLVSNLRKWGFFASDTISAGPFSLTPSLRYDHINTQNGLFSPSLGVTWGPTATTVFRAYAGRGFSLPIAKENVRSERVFSLQAGVEQGIPGYVWMKTTLFRNDVSDLIAGQQNQGKQRRQGVQVEVRTVPVFDTSLSAGYVFIDKTDRDTGKVIPGSPRYTVDLGLRYAGDAWRASLMGHYIWFVPDNVPSDFHRFVWDLNVSRKVPLRYADGEIFFSGHNILNANQFGEDFGPNPGRWFEGGLRVRF